MKKILFLLLTLIVLTKSKAQDCDTLSYEWETPTPTTTVYNFGSGRLTGIPDPSNSITPTDTKTIFEGFTSPNPGTTSVGAVLLGLGFLSDANDNLRIDVMVYNDNTGRPGTQVGGVTGLSPTSLGVVHNFREFWIELPSLPVPATSRFYIGVVMHPGDASDQLVVQANAKGQGNGDGSNSITTTQYGNEKLLSVYSSDIDLKIIAKLGIAEDASFSYGSSSYCSNGSDPTPAVTGDAGGSFSATPSGLSLNSTTGKIDVSTSTKGTYTVKYKTSGSCAVSETQSVEIVNDQPTITCPSNQAIAFNASCQYTLPDYRSLATANDNCSTPTITQSPAPGSILSAIQTITLTANDGDGNIRQCTFEVIPSDNTDPVISCLSNQTINIDGVTSALVPDYTSLVTATDNCDGSPTITQLPLAGSSIGLGTTIITLSAEDASSNDASCTFDLLVQDITPPVVTITSLVADPTNGAFTATFTFSEDVTDFDITDINVGNGTAGSFAATSASVYTAEITPTTDGTVTVDVAANLAEDAATNGNTAATQFNVAADLTAPAITISSLVTDPTNGAFTATFTFSEDVTGFDVTDINVDNGTVSTFNVLSSTVYSAWITPTTDGTVTIDVATNVAKDVATNGNTAATQFSVEADFTTPTITITSLIADPANGAFTATFTFSEDVAGFDITDITVGNGTAGSFAATSASVYTAEITPTTDGTVTVDVAANVAEDAATNGNTAATQFNVAADLTAPAITISSLVTDPTNGTFTATFIFSEDVTDFDITDINVGNGTVSTFNVLSSTVYSAWITPTTDGTVTIDVATNVAEDVATNGNTAATQFSVEADLTAPTITITNLVSDPTNGTFTVTFTFSEDVTGFDVTDITVGNGTTGGFAATSASVYTVEITPTTDGAVNVDIAANVAEDAANNGNTGTTPFSIFYDGTVPSVVITSSESSATNSNPFPVTISFSEEVTGFTLEDIVVNNGSATDFTTSDNIVFTTNIIPASDGNVTVDIVSATAHDLAGNGNTAATTFSIVYDSQVDQIICENITVQLDANGAVTIEVSQIDNGSSDSFGIASHSIDITSFNCSNVGDNNVTLTVTDINGNVATCVAVVTVEDTIGPTVITQDITVALDVNGQASITPADIDNGSTDNCGIATRTLDISSFDVPTTESTTVTLAITDVNGNSASATALVTFIKVGQSIIFEPIADKKAGQDPVVLQATGGGSGLPITFSIVTEPSSGVASLVDGIIIIEGPGSVVVTARQAGNEIFQEAEDVTQTFDILSSELFLPTLFTPNDDGTNDRFILRGGGNVNNIEFRVFDREGNLVFNSQSITDLFQSGWDGTHDGKEQPQGAYAWVVKGSFQDGSPLLINGKNTGIIRLAR